MVKIGIVVPQIDFQDEEYFIAKSVLENAGFEIATISPKKAEVLGIFGGVIDSDISAKEAKAKNFNAIIFIGGNGMEKNLDNKEFQKIAKDAFKEKRLVAAICIAPALLAMAGVLKGKKATVWADEANKTAVKILQNNGAIYENVPVVVDENIITASGPSQTRKFAEVIVKLLKP